MIEGNCQSPNTCTLPAASLQAQSLPGRDSFRDLSQTGFGIGLRAMAKEELRIKNFELKKGFYHEALEGHEIISKIKKEANDAEMF
jgi:hypothetical protein